MAATQRDANGTAYVRSGGWYRKMLPFVMNLVCCLHRRKWHSVLGRSFRVTIVVDGTEHAAKSTNNGWHVEGCETRDNVTERNQCARRQREEDRAKGQAQTQTQTQTQQTTPTNWFFRPQQASTVERDTYPPLWITSTAEAVSLPHRVRLSEERTRSNMYKQRNRDGRRARSREERCLHPLTLFFAP